jgi:hypothetical protein
MVKVWLPGPTLEKLRAKAAKAKVSMSSLAGAVLTESLETGETPERLRVKSLINRAVGLLLEARDEKRE